MKIAIVAPPSEFFRIEGGHMALAIAKSKHNKIDSILCIILLKLFDVTMVAHGQMDKRTFCKKMFLGFPVYCPLLPHTLSYISSIHCFSIAPTMSRANFTHCFILAF